jgi:predicted nucleotidyltransferase
MSSSIVKQLYDAGELKGIPKFIPNNMCYEVLTGSTAYGVAGEVSDWDVVGFYIPTKTEIFPHLDGYIHGFGKPRKPRVPWQKHHIDYRGKEYDITVYSIVNFFDLCMGMNPNMIDLLFVPVNCVLHSTVIGNLVRESRHLFLSKLCWHKFKGYAYSQLNKMEHKTAVGKRVALIEAHGYDTKFAYNVVRLIGEVEQLLTTGDMDLQQDKERLRAIREGKWPMERVKAFFVEKEKALEELYNSSPLPYSPREEEIKALLVRCLEMHYGDLSSSELVVPGKAEAALRQIRDIVSKAIPE